MVNELEAKQAAVDILKRDLTRADIKIDELRGLLRRLEWTPLYFSSLKKIVYTCVVCSQSKEDGHAKDCKLAKELMDE